MSDMDRKRQQGIVTGINYDNDHDTFYVMIEFKGMGQGFGGIVFDEKTKEAFEKDLCELFAVESFDEIVGKPCFGLWCVGENNEAMEGLENEAGDRFTITGFRRKHWPDKFKTALELRRASIQSTIAWAKRRLRDAEQDLAELESNFTEWETAPLDRKVQS